MLACWPHGTALVWFVGNGLDRSGDIFAYAVMRFTAGLVIRCGNDNTANHFANVQ